MRILTLILVLSVSLARAHEPEVSIRVSGETRIIESNGIPDHETGPFPNAHNPNTIREQKYHFEMPLKPIELNEATPCEMQIWGVAINGVVFDPGTAEFWHADRSSGWRYEALGGYTADLGLDENHAHVQPGGEYHYHGLPAVLLKGKTGVVQLGWAADGFPVYGEMGYKKPKDASSKIIPLRSSYKLKEGSRPSNNAPGGPYDGDFTNDYEYVAGLGELDECNGRYGVTPEFPEGTYYYVLTSTFPFVPRCWKGTPDASFKKKPMPGRGPNGQRPPRPRWKHNDDVF